MFPHVHTAQIKLSGASAAPTFMGKLNAAHAIISQQAETIAIQQTVIENAHEIKATADEALACAEDETEAAHLQWMECLQKLGIAEMQRQMTYFVLGDRRLALCTPLSPLLLQAPRCQAWIHHAHHCTRCKMASPQVKAMQARHGPVCLKRLLSRTDES